MSRVAQGRTGRPRLQTLENVVTQAIALVEERGAGGLTMGDLARRLGVATMTLYGYVPSRDGLIDLMLARLLDEQPPAPELEPAHWIDSLVDHMAAVRAWAIGRPALMHLVRERPRLTEDVARHVHADLDALIGLGMSPERAMTLRHTLATQLRGQLEYELLRRESEDATVTTELTGTLSPAVAHLQSVDLGELYLDGVRALLVGFAAL